MEHHAHGTSYGVAMFLASAVDQQQALPSRRRLLPAVAAVLAPSPASGSSKKKTAAATTDTPQCDPLIQERYVAELAVQRAVLATKTVLLNWPPRPTAAAAQAAATTASLGHVKRPGAKTVAKAGYPPVRVAEFAGRALLIAALREAFPRDGFLGQETADELRANSAMMEEVWKLVKTTELQDWRLEALLGRPQSREELLALLDLGGGVKRAEPGKRYWVMAPVDGTAAFLQGGQYAVALGLVLDGREILGVVACPNMPVTTAFAAPAVVRPKAAAAAAAAGQDWAVDNLETNIDKQGLGIMMAAVLGHGVTIRRVTNGKLDKPAKVDRTGLPPPPQPNSIPGAAKFCELVFVDSERSSLTQAPMVKLFAYKGYEKSVQLTSSHMRYAVMALGYRSWAQIRWPKGPSGKGRCRWSIWDHVGTPLLYTQSGPGVVTDMNGMDLRFDEGTNLESTWGVIAADNGIHHELTHMVSLVPKPA
ncbi:uncharacterized protein C8A04DRAFT_40717 [Dichotomopilus funicola]|uniref:Uncharacterized protein n=1 Tax=Dichotomopilus funicola TaxID=1934379 RepID=A0AAN6UUW4_9PEZI|nr:hypothetical protein C8A04DRAFT_40717 [Dichotomopilus funicola]